MMIRYVVVLLAFFAVLAPVPVLAWGPEGHQIVAAIAARHLTTKARAEVATLLGGDATTMMVLDSSWADEIRTDRPETASWHYVNIEIGSAGYDAARDCPHDDCVVAQINRDARILATAGASRVAKVEALRFLIHFVGDVHQPLHAANRHDKGGNDDIVYYRGMRTSLHRLWDSEVVSALGLDALRLAAEIDGSLSPARKAQMSSGGAADWANDSFSAAGKIYAVARQELPDNYARAQDNLVRMQLAKAGLRLATLLNRVL